MKLLKAFISVITAAIVAVSCLPSAVLAANYEQDITFWGPYTLDVSLPEEPERVLLENGENTISLKDGRYEKYIDRIDFSTNAREVYDLLVEGSDSDGNNDFLINDLYFVEDETIANSPVAACTLLTVQVLTDPQETIDGLEPEILAAMVAFTRDYPEVFWLSNQFSWGYILKGDQLNFVLLLKDSNNEYDIREKEYQSEEKIYSMIAQRDSACTQILANFPQNGTRYEQVDYLNDWLTTHNHYNTVDLNEPRAHSCISALLEDSIGQYAPVCEGYATAFKVLCDLVGIPCVLESGIGYTSTGSEGHMWNLVQMENSNWYAVDVTWNDPVVVGVSGLASGYECDDYLLAGSETVVSGISFSDSHQVTNQVTSSIIGFTNGPALSGSKYMQLLPDSAGEKFGDNLYWNFNEQTGVLTISGIGAMDDDESRNPPWNNIKYEIREVIIESGVTTVGDWAFRYCMNLNKVSLPETVTSIGMYAFENCPLTEITLPGSLQTLKINALAGTKLTTLYIPASVEKIERLGTLSDLSSVTVDVSNETYWSIDGVLFAPSGKTGVSGLEFYPPCKTDAVYSVPADVTVINTDAFNNCRYLQKLILHKNVESVSTTFLGCSSLTDFEVSPDNTHCFDIDGVLYTDTGTNQGICLIAYPVGRDALYYNIPGNVQTIDTSAFRGATKIKYLDIPNSVTSIGQSAFYECSSLESIALPSSITAIPGYAFAFCTSLKTIVIPEAVSKIESMAFWEVAENLQLQVYYRGTQEQWQQIEIASAMNDAVKNGNIIYQYFPVVTSNKTATIGNTGALVGNIASYLQDAGLYNCVELTSGAEIITANSFSDLTGVECIALPDTITTIEENAFASCASLTDICYTGNNPDILHALQLENVTIRTIDRPVAGDVDWDGEVAGDDAITMIRYLSGWNVAGISDVVGDVNGDGNTDARDAVYLTRKVADWDGYN